MISLVLIIPLILLSSSLDNALYILVTGTIIHRFLIFPARVHVAANSLYEINQNQYHLKLSTIQSPPQSHTIFWLCMWNY